MTPLVVYGPWPWGIGGELRARLIKSDFGPRVEVLTGDDQWRLAEKAVALEILGDELARIGQLFAAEDLPSFIRPFLRLDQENGAIAAFRVLRRHVLGFDRLGSLQTGGVSGEAQP